MSIFTRLTTKNRLTAYLKTRSTALISIMRISDSCIQNPTFIHPQQTCLIFIPQTMTWGEHTCKTISHLTFQSTQVALSCWIVWLSLSHVLQDLLTSPPMTTTEVRTPTDTRSVKRTQLVVSLLRWTKILRLSTKMAPVQKILPGTTRARTASTFRLMMRTKLVFRSLWFATVIISTDCWSWICTSLF